METVLFGPGIATRTTVAGGGGRLRNESNNMAYIDIQTIPGNPRKTSNKQQQ